MPKDRTTENSHQITEQPQVGRVGPSSSTIRLGYRNAWPGADSLRLRLANGIVTVSRTDRRHRQRRYDVNSIKTVNQNSITSQCSHARLEVRERAAGGPRTSVPSQLRKGAPRGPVIIFGLSERSTWPEAETPAILSVGIGHSARDPEVPTSYAHVEQLGYLRLPDG